MTAPYHPAQLPSTSEDVADDWELLFSAITARLRVIASAPPTTPATRPLEDSAARMQAAVLECATALDQLRSLIKDQMLVLAQRSPMRRRGESL